MTAKRLVAGAGVVGVVVLLLFLLGAFGGGIDYVTGPRAGNLDGGSDGGVTAPMRRGESEMMGDTVVKNVGTTPILIESIEPLSTSPQLKVTRGRMYRVRRRAGFEQPPLWWRGWPPKGVPKGKAPFKNPHPDYLALPTEGEIPPGDEFQLVYGVFLHADPSPKLRVTGLRITFKQDGHTIVWIKPDTFGVMRCTPYYCGHR